ncbi:hypothetical protein NPIL_654431 [Nephila pilipes]|uniref:Uncharacterized protein n=1 Tax=Nephila pilipes TaxID=299642 RepID=A0A8X6PPU8_NEPPI|nr:hypothetical protein NPIL_654431 [Nephila pilipes]
MSDLGILILPMEKKFDKLFASMAKTKTVQEFLEKKIEPQQEEMIIRQKELAIEIKESKAGQDEIKVEIQKTTKTLRDFQQQIKSELAKFKSEMEDIFQKVQYNMKDKMCE